MAKRILKYTLSEALDQVVETHRGAKFLHFNHQYGRRTLWMEVNTNNPRALREVTILHTGDDIDSEGWEYMGTLLEHKGQYVIHGYIKNEV